ncbi:flagellin [Brucella intermedia]|uniref:flagellin N-terminal helical domain-containing protein n=1 Tax=Brucella TaxID=234 RepID=UPI00094669A4|nr:flagellin [Brucella intermedia]
MSSLLTNTSAMTALQTLANTNKNLAAAQNRISTGMKIAEASDNAAYWSIATTMRSDNSANETVKTSLGLGMAKVDVAYTAVNDTVKKVEAIRNKIVAAKNGSAADRAKLQEEISKAQGQLRSSAKAVLGGTALLSTDSSNEQKAFKITSGYNRGDDGSVSIDTIDIDLDAVRLVDTSASGAKTGVFDSEFVIKKAGTDGTEKKASILDLDVAADDIDGDMIDAMLKGVEGVADKLQTAATALGAAKTRIETQTSFIGVMQNAVDRGIGAIVDADMTKESARLSALQVQQQLGTQALSIANSSTNEILKLFR